MKILIDNNQRVFQVVDSMGHQWFCNLHHLNDVVKENRLVEGYYKIYHFWNNKPKIISNKELNGLFEAHRIEKQF
jgi:hypothetical protein